MNLPLVVYILIVAAIAFAIGSYAGKMMKK